MKKVLQLSVIWVSMFAAVTSCKKEEAIASDSTQISTSKDGSMYVLDTMNSKIEWKGFKIVKSENTSHFGTIKFESGDLTVKDGKLQSGIFVANMSSLKNVDLKDEPEQQSKLENHLKSADFFEVENFPTASYEITKITPSADGDYNTVLDGNLTIKGITKPVQFNANVTVNNGEVSIYTEQKDILREDFGVKFQMPVQNGLLRNEINVQIAVKAREKK